jgi:hypothetical protein
MDDEYKIGDYAVIHTLTKTCLIGVVIELHYCENLVHGHDDDDVIYFRIINNLCKYIWMVPYDKSKLNDYGISFIRKPSNEEVLQYIMEQ